MKIKWLSEARNELRELVRYYRVQVGRPYAKKFADRVLGEVARLADFPEMGALKYDTLMGKYGFRALFIGNYICVSRATPFTSSTSPTPEEITSIIFSGWNKAGRYK